MQASSRKGRIRRDAKRIPISFWSYWTSHGEHLRDTEGDERRDIDARKRRIGRSSAVQSGTPSQCSSLGQCYCPQGQSDREPRGIVALRSNLKSIGNKRDAFAAIERTLPCSGAHGRRTPAVARRASGATRAVRRRQLARAAVARLRFRPLSLVASFCKIEHGLSDFQKACPFAPARFRIVGACITRRCPTS